MLAKETDKLESLLGVNSNFKGELNIKGTLRVDGKVEPTDSLRSWYRSCWFN